MYMPPSFVESGMEGWYDNTVKREHVAYYVSRKNILVWASALLMLCSIAARSVYFVIGDWRADGDDIAFGLVLPILSELAFVLYLLLRGQTRLYQTSIPVVCCCAVMFVRAMTLTPLLLAVICCLICAFVAVFYTATVSGAVRVTWPLAAMLGAIVAAHFFVDDLPAIMAGSRDLAGWLPAASVLLAMVSLFCLVSAVHRDDTPGYKLRWGDRSDGRRIRTIPPMDSVSPYIQKRRTAAQNLFRTTLDYEEAARYIHRKRREESLDGFGIMHLIIASYVRTVSQRPRLNRFISGCKLYSRGRNIEVIMAVKKRMDTDSPDTMIKVYFAPQDTVNDVYRKLEEQISAVKNAADEDTDFDVLAGMINAMPGPIVRFFIWCIDKLDYYGLLPRKLTRLSPFHGSLVITSMGSLGIPPVFHHLYDFGNVPIFISFGAVRRETETLPDGTARRRSYVDMTVTTDERICDGFYFANTFKMMQSYFNSPERLDVPPETVVDDIP